VSAVDSRSRQETDGLKLSIKIFTHSASNATCVAVIWKDRAFMRKEEDLIANHMRDRCCFWEKSI